MVIDGDVNSDSQYEMENEKDLTSYFLIVIMKVKVIWKKI
jgi:hypothetical protein